LVYSSDKKDTRTIKKETIMKSKVRVQRKIEAIKNMTDPLKALEELADLTYEIGEEACREREEIRALTEQNRLALIGNGDPQNSVIGRLACVEILMNDIDEIKNLLTGGLKQKEPSLRARMDSFENYVKESKKMQWYILTAIIGYVIAQVLLAIF
jgi:hypothetical protein